MPEISRFFGIVIGMYYREHVPPHFHATHGEYHVTVQIPSGIVEGRFPRRALGLVLEWADAHREELMDNWRRAQQRLPMNDITPLE